MMKIGYQPGKGLGTHLQGRLKPVRDERIVPGSGLGYRSEKVRHEIVQQEESEGGHKIWKTMVTPCKENRDPLT